MSSILNMLYSVEDNGLNLVILVPLFAVLVAAVAFLLKFTLRKPEVTKKTQIGVKKQQKMQKASNNKQKEENINSEKKEKVSKEKKLSSSPKRSLDKQAGNEAVKSNKKQHNAVDEKPSKKNSAQTKKHQVNNNANTKNNTSSTKNNQTNKKQTVDIFINKEEEGEWQMVTTKKQKLTKQEEKVEITTTPTKSAKKSQKSVEKANKQNNKTKNAKDVTEKNDNSTKFLNSEVTTPEEVQTVNSYREESIKNTNENTSLAALETAKVDSDSNNTKNTLVNTDESITAQEDNSIGNVAFDELGDDGWTDTKPQKKNRRRALRE